ncbi:mediator of rna polymerase ii transcription subunit 5 [Trichoderma cornu-damae]|uniref:Mediator of RNA polymerase II transcription subunit 5 n=1 Tax=Trichoderma cornu-damae TaxID=654480 RepID=A0A9P8TVT3_9HYPO|nr:mediator of rna polymerase ii transcription subunit 5 [Trichoderma cornu-damae]
MEGRVSAGEALRESIQYWSGFISKCLTKRLDAGPFEDYVRLVFSKHQLPPEIVADFFLRPQKSNCVSPDPRIPPYISVLTQLRYVDAASILRALYRYSSLHAQVPPQAAQQQQQQQRRRQGEGAVGGEGEARQESRQEPKRPSPTRWKSSSWLEEVMFYHVIKLVVEGTAFKDSRTALELIHIISRWMSLFAVVSNSMAADMLGGSLQDPQVRHEMDVSRAAFVPLLLRLVDNAALVKVISHPTAKGPRKGFSESLASFVQALQPVPQFVEKLEVFRTEVLAPLDPVDKNSQAANAAMDELLDSAVGLDGLAVPDMPISNTRAGLYVYLGASGNTQQSAIDLILASFDLLANAVFRNEGPRDAHLLRSFLTNKVPLILAQLCPPGFSTPSAEFCITEALSQVDTSVFPTASLMFDESRNNNPYTESVREEFCSACALHGLIEREHVERILGESSMSYEPSQEKYSKEKLVQSCLSDPDKIQVLIRDMDKMDGNVGAVCQALVELLRQLCNSKETMSLKLLCSQLVQKPQSLDVLLLFEKLPAVLEPICQLLDGWRYEEDQGEYQPVYEEFGAILLLVLAFAYRYNLSPADIGILSADSNIGKIISRAHISRELDELSEQEDEHLGGWIHGLFDSDAGGLGDDLMSSCPPAEFYLLIATLFQNIVIAYTQGFLTDDALRSGVEYLVDTFLLPSLIPAIRFLSDYLWVEQKEQKSIIKILQLILLPTSISGEASTMLASVKGIVAKPLEHSLRAYQRQDPKNQDIEPLLRALKDSLPLSRRTGAAEHQELEMWATSSSSGLSGAVKHLIQALVQWCMHPEMAAMPTPYTHRQIIATLKIVGASRLLRVMVEEVRQQVLTGSGSVAYDVATALICAPNASNELPPTSGLLDDTGNMPPLLQRPLTLRQVLKMEAVDYRKLQKKDAELAEIVVRLHRRVEAQMVLPPPPMLQTADMQLDLTGDAASLGDSMAAAGGVQGDGAMAIDGVGGLDMGIGVVSSDLGLGASSNNGALDASAEADLFGSLDTDMDVFDGWGGMDLGGP